MLGPKLTAALWGYDSTIRGAFDTSSGVAQFVRLDVQGTQAVIDALKSLPGNVSRRIQRKTMKAVIEPIFQDVRSSVPVDSGQLRDSVTKRVGISKKYGTITGTVSHKYADTFYAHWVDQGWNLTGHRAGKKRGPFGHPKVLRRVEGRYIFRKALERHADGSVSAFYRDLKESTDEVQKELGASND